MKTISIPSEVKWISSAQGGDPHAFRQLVDAHADQVRKTVTAMLGEGPEAEDTAQEVFIRLHKSLPNFKGDAQLATYLHRIAINLSINVLNKRKKRNNWRLSFNTQRENQIARIPDRDNHAQRSDLQDLLEKALQSLDTEFRSVVVLRLVQGYSSKETAKILSIPEGTVASRLARAQKKLRQLMDKHL